MKKKTILFLLTPLLSILSFGQAETKDGKETNKTGISLIQDDRIMFLNAYNFDFGSTSLKSNYVGHINLFSPSINKKEKNTQKMKDSRWGWGFNTGILKINYQQKDSSNTFNSFKENVFISPFDVLKDSVRYLKQINNYKVEKSNTVWSFYVQPTFELTKASSDQHIYLHGHAELLASQWHSKTSIMNSKTDTATFIGPAPKDFVIRSNISSEVNSTVNTVAGYFGLGLTFDLKPWTKGSFFFQPTVGFTTNKPSPSSTDISNNIQTGGTGLRTESKLGKTWNPFYLVRAYYTHSIAEKATEKGTTIVLGMDIRGFFPVYVPQYAAYIGLNVGFDSILDLIKGKENSEPKVSPTPAPAPAASGN